MVFCIKLKLLKHMNVTAQSKDIFRGTTKQVNTLFSIIIESLNHKSLKETKDNWKLN